MSEFDERGVRPIGTVFDYFFPKMWSSSDPNGHIATYRVKGYSDVEVGRIAEQVDILEFRPVRMVSVEFDPQFPIMTETYEDGRVYKRGIPA